MPNNTRSAATKNSAASSGKATGSGDGIDDPDTMEAHRLLALDKLYITPPFQIRTMADHEKLTGHRNFKTWRSMVELDLRALNLLPFIETDCGMTVNVSPAKRVVLDAQTVQYLRASISKSICHRITNANTLTAFKTFQTLVELFAGLAEQPRFAEPIPNVTVALGRDASLPCVVNNLGTYKVAWIHIDRQMILTIHRHVISRVPRFSVSHDGQKTWLLHVASAQAEDRGYYMCQVNTNPMISQVGYLQVVVPPDIVDEESTPSSVAVRENQNLTLTCKAQGFPDPKIMWKREDGNEIVLDRKKKISVNMHNGENLTITKISRTDMGAYLCIATNGVPPSVSKRIIVDVEFPPMILVSNQLVGAPVGTDVTIDCQTEAHPRAISYWMFGDGMLLSANKHGTEISENSYRTHMKLTVKKLMPSDFGTYKCISKNSLGETEGTIRLYEITMPSASPREHEAITSRANREGYVDGDITESLMIQPTKPVRNELDNRSANLPKQENSLPKTSGCQPIPKWPVTGLILASVLICYKHT